MRFFSTLRPWIAASMLLAAWPAAADDLTVERYVDVTIARLELAETTWTEEDRSPTQAEEDELFEIFATTAEAYLAFPAKHREAIEDYLEANPDLRDAIQTLSDLISQRIEQGEAP